MKIAKTLGKNFSVEKYFVISINSILLIVQSYSNNKLKQTPALKILLPVVVGILLQYHLKLSITLTTLITVLAGVSLIAHSFLSSSKKFSIAWLKGLFITILFIGIGGCLSFTKNISNRPAWVGNYFQKEAPLIVTLQENLAIKEKSYKAQATVEAVYKNNQWQQVEGDVLLYFKKDSTIPNIHYGSQILITKNIAGIINSGNPGGFNYAQYCSFQDIHYQGFLRDDDYTILSSTKTNWFSKWLIDIRTNTLKILKSNIQNTDELSIAEALLIGYRDELNRDLVRAYSNTGVVHIIAISGLHLGMIYGLILLLFRPFARFRWSKIAKPITIIFVLWMFSFIAGMAPSILRSAIMFTCIAIGESFGKRSNIYNGLALSALIILLMNPFSLWDVGFQLSYTAVLSIIVFSPYIKKWFYFKNKLLAGFWELNSITLSAQILTLPIVLYHFHQFPILFLITNIFAVPWSGFILYSELFLLIFSWWHAAANLIGAVSEWMIKVMNIFILNINGLPFAIWESLQISIPEAIILFFSIIGYSFWMMEKKKKGFFIGSIAFLCFLSIRCIDFINRNKQEKLIVYNVPNHTAIDLIQGRSYQFIGDSILQEDGFLQNFHIKPSRVLHRINAADSLTDIVYQNNIISSKNKKIVVVDNPIFLDQYRNYKTKVDAIIITKNPKIYINNLAQAFDCKQYIFDGSNSMYKISKWVKDCDSLHLQYHICSLQGAFSTNL